MVHFVGLELAALEWVVSANTSSFIHDICWVLHISIVIYNQVFSKKCEKYLSLPMRTIEWENEFISQQNSLTNISSF